MRTTLRRGLRALLAATPAGRAWLERRRRARWGAAVGSSDLRTVFTSHYQTNYWGHPETVSGPGSSLAATRLLREALPPLLRRLGVRRLLDAPCGDYNWFRHLPPDEGLDYLGGDIVAALVERNQALHGGPRTRFVTLDLTRDPLPPADLWLCRDCFPHLPQAAVLAALAGFARSPIPWLLATSHAARENLDSAAGTFRPLDLEKPPYSLPPPEVALPDGVPGHLRKLGLWSREEVAEALRR